METFLREGVAAIPNMDFQSMSSTISDITNRNIAGDAHFFEDTTAPITVKEYLSSTKETEKLKGMKWLLAMLSKGKDVSDFFPDVVKNVIVKSIEVKKMVYNYLVHYADFNPQCRELALLSINSFQKDLSGPNQLFRGLALRVMTSIRVPDIIQIQLMAVKKCGTDTSPYVRKCAATAVTKIFSMDSEQLQQLQQILEKLLSDSSTMVLGSAIAAFNEISPTSYQLIHPNYRKICHLLADLDEWSQISCLDVLTRYVRNQFTDPAPGANAIAQYNAKHRSSSVIKGGQLGSTSRSTMKRTVVRKAFYSDEEDVVDEEDVEIESSAFTPSYLSNNNNYSKAPSNGSTQGGISGGADVDGDMEPDHRLALKSAYPLLRSRNAGVVLGVCNLQNTCGSQSDNMNNQLAKALVRILRNHREIQFVVLTSISSMARERPYIFRPYLSEFFMKSDDPIFNRLLKLDILASICFKENVYAILRELQHYVKHGNESFVCAAIRTMGQVADCETAVANACMDGLLHIICCSKSDKISGEAVIVLRQLIQQSNKHSNIQKVLFQLTKLLLMVQQPSPESDPGNITSIASNTPSECFISGSSARASIVWLVGEFQDMLGKVVPDILRLLARGFVEESTETKLQILNFAAKLSLKKPDDETVQTMMTYVLELSRYDIDTDLRDRSRLITALMGLTASSNDDEDEKEEEGGGSDKNPAMDEAAIAQFAERAKGILLASKPPPVTLLGSVELEGLPNFSLGSLSSLLGYYVNGYRQMTGWALKSSQSNVRDGVAVVATMEVQKKFYEESSSSSDDDSNHGGSLKGFYDNDKSRDHKSRKANTSNDSNRGPDSSESSDEEESSEAGSGSSGGDTEDSSDDEEGDDDDEDNSDGSNSDDSSDESSTSTSSSSISEENNNHNRRSNNQNNRDLINNRDAKGPLHVVAQPTRILANSRQQGTTAMGSGMRRVATTKTNSAVVKTSTSPGTGGQDIFGNQGLIPLPATMANAPSSLNDFLGVGDSQLSSLSIASSTMSGGAVNPSPLDIFDDHKVASISQGHNTSAGLLDFHLLSVAPASNEIVKPTAAMSSAITSSSLMDIDFSKPMTKTASSGSSAAPLEISIELSASRTILKPEMGGGLLVTFLFRHGAAATVFPGSVCGLVVVRNTRDHPLRRIRISFPHDIRKTVIEEIAQLSAGQEIQIPTEMVMDGLAGKSLKVDIRSDLGAFVGTFQAEAWELLSPILITPVEFMSLRKQLSGLNEAKKIFPISSLGLSSELSSSRNVAVIMRGISTAVRRVLNLQVINNATEGECQLAGAFHKKGPHMPHDKVLVSVFLDSSYLDCVTMQVNCEDPIICTSLLEGIKKLWK